AGLLPDARLTIYPDSAHGCLFQYYDEFAADVHAFLEESNARQSLGRGRRRPSDERRGGFADSYLLSSLRRRAGEVRRQQGRLGYHGSATGAVARNPLGLPSHLAPRLSSRAGCRYRYAGIRPFRWPPGADWTGRFGS